MSEGSQDQATAAPVVLLERRDGILVITLNRPEARNSLNLALTRAISNAFDELDSDPQLSAAVVTGAGKGFCSGMDLKAFVAGEEVWEGEEDDRGLRRIVTRPPRKPLIAAVEGFAVAGGFELALACDLLVAGRSAKFGVPEVKRSLVAAGGALLELPRRCGPGAAMKLALTGDLIDGTEAAAIGLVDELSEDGEALETALALARKIGENGPLAVIASKQVMRGAADWSQDEFWARQKEICDPVFASHDATEGATAFAEKRAPVWTGEMSMAAAVATELGREPAGETIRSFWDGRVAATPTAPFLVYGQGTESYEEFDAVVNSSANGLAAEGVRAGDRVALLLPSDRQLLVLELALAKLGAVMVPMISNLTRPEIVYVLDHCEASVFITDAAGWKVSTADGDLELDHELVAYVLGGAEGARDADVLVADEISSPPQPDLDPGDPMAIMYTSGSTGKPKGVIQPSAGFATAGRALAARLGAGASDNFFCAIPIFHTAGAHMLLAPAIAAGARFTLIPRFSRSEFWDQVRDSGATLSIVMPAQLSILMTAPPSERDRDHELRCLASHVWPADFCERFGVDVVTTWAMTETSGMGTMSAPGSSSHPEKYIGRPVPEEAEAKIVKPDGEAAASMEPGELWYRHPHVMRAYHRNPTASAESLVDGWVRTGDLCAADEQGGIYFHGRIKHVIKRAGENVSGEEVEAAVVAHPEVEECIVVGVPDPIYTEEIYATVSLRSGAELDESELIEWCRQQLAAWKLPRYLDFGDEELPKLANGKPDRRRIGDAAATDAAWDRVAAEGGDAR